MTDLTYLTEFFKNFGHWIATGAVGIWTYLRTQDKDNADSIKALAEDVSKLKTDVRDKDEHQNTRLTTLESALQSMPTATDFSELRADAAASRAKLDGITDLLRRMEHQTDLIQQHLLNGVRK